MKAACTLGLASRGRRVWVLNVTITHFINRQRVRCPRLGAAARREEGEYPLWIFDRRATLQQRQRSATLRAAFWQAAGCVAPQSQSHEAMLLRRVLPAACQNTAHPLPIHEMGSSLFFECDIQGKKERGASQLRVLFLRFTVRMPRPLGSAFFS